MASEDVESECYYDSTLEGALDSVRKYEERTNSRFVILKRRKYGTNTFSIKRYIIYGKPVKCLF